MAKWSSKLRIIIDARINQVALSGSLPVLADAVCFHRVGFLLRCSWLASTVPWASLLGHCGLAAFLAAVVDRALLKR